MTLPLSGQIRLSQVNTELGLSSTAQINMGSAAVRTLFGVPSGQIKMSDGYGKSAEFIISSDQTNFDLRSWLVSQGWNQSDKPVVRVASGVYVYSTDTSVAGMTITGSFPKGIELINDGFIIGKGGDAGSFITPVSDFAAKPGGPAINLGTNVTIRNNSYIAGGGGGGGTGLSSEYNGNSGGGGGAGGGTGGRSSPTAAGSQGGGPGQPGSNGITYFYWFIDLWYGGGGGGRILPGTGGIGGIDELDGVGKGGGGGGGGGVFVGDDYLQGGQGGSAGNPGQPGAGFIPSPGYGTSAGGGGGGWGAAGGNGFRVGAIGGKAVNLNGYTVTWSATGTRYGAIS